jgi:ornithine decarboxylase
MKKPKFEISKRQVLEKFDEVQNVADFVSYSSKTNPIVTGILEEEKNCLFSIHSINELKNVKDNSRVLFLAQGWDEQEFIFLLKKGIRKFVVDNIKDLNLLKEIMINRKENIDLFLRLKLKENTLKTEKYFVFGFNSDFINKEILELKKFDFIKQIGIHFHRKTQNISEWDLRSEIENVLSEEVLEEINYMIVGGGLPSVYANTNLKVFSGIFEKLNSFRKWLNSKEIKMIIEPGRYIAAPAGKLISHIKSVYENNIIVDVSVYNSDLDALIVPVKLLVEGEVSKENGKPYVIKGITPCSMDLFRYRVYLNRDLKVGDELIFLNAGAYNFTTDFCNLKKIGTKIVN